MGMFGQTLVRDPLGISSAPLQIAQAQAPSLMPTVKKHPGFNEPGGLAEKLGQLGDFLFAAQGNPYFMQASEARRREQEEREQQLSDREYEMNRPQVMSLGDGGIASVTRGGDVRMLRDPVQHRTPLEQNIDLYRQYKPDASAQELADIVRRGIPGAAYDLGVQQPIIDARTASQTAVADHRLGNSIALKGVPTYAQMHPKAGGGSMGLHGRSKANPYPVGSRSELEALPRGTWVSLPNGAVVQRR